MASALPVCSSVMLTVSPTFVTACVMIPTGPRSRGGKTLTESDRWNPFGGVDRKAQNAAVATVPTRCRVCHQDIVVGARMVPAVEPEGRGRRHFGSPTVKSWRHIKCTP